MCAFQQGEAHLRNSTVPSEWSLISYRDLRANGIDVSTDVDDHEEVLVLRRGRYHLATAKAGVTSLYEIMISPLDASIFHFSAAVDVDEESGISGCYQE